MFLASVAVTAVQSAMKSNWGISWDCPDSRASCAQTFTSLSAAVPKADQAEIVHMTHGLGLTDFMQDYHSPNAKFQVFLSIYIYIAYI